MSTSPRRALLIGTEHYSDGRLSRLPSTRADVEQLSAVLGDRAIGGYTVQTHLDLDAAAARKAIRQFLTADGEHEQVLVYLTGHGIRVPLGEFVFAASDTDPDRLAETGVTAAFVNRCLEDCFVPQRIVLLDCCFSGGFATGFRTEPTAKAAAAVPTTPVAARGAYVLSSSGVGEPSFAGGGTIERPEPSTFTGAVLEVLRTGAAGSAASGRVMVEDLFFAVQERLEGTDPPQGPTKSSIGITGHVPIARRPQGGAPQRGTERSAPNDPLPTDRGGVPNISTLLAYYRDAVRAESLDLPLLPVRGPDHVVIPGAERVLSGRIDADGCIPLPTGSARLAERDSPDAELWAGWPIVLLDSSPDGRPWPRPKIAPLLMRRVAVDPDGRLRPTGAVVPHAGLLRERLGVREAEIELAGYRPTWHWGELDAMAEDAGQLMRHTLGLDCVEELRPEHLAPTIDDATPLAGARNAQILLLVPTAAATRGLLADLDAIAANPDHIRGTALAALLPDAPSPDKVPPPLPVAPTRANDAQREVLNRAMTDRLTVASGPPGTGKSQLIVDVVATTVSAGQRVLVASTNNQAVDEVYERCQALVPGSLVRTGSRTGPRDYRAEEAAALRTLLAVDPPGRGKETLRTEHRRALEQLGAAEARVAHKAKAEAEALQALRAEKTALRRSGDLSRTLLDGWPGRAARLANAPSWLFGEWRRRRFLGTAALGGNTVALCQDLADLAEAQERSRALQEAARRLPEDKQLDIDLAAATAELERTSRALLDGVVRAAAIHGRREIGELLRAQDSDRSDWGYVRRALQHVRGWAVTSLSARRFPPNPAMFDLVVIDEASQCSIPSVVPLLFRGRRALVIGDPQQLPPILTLPDQTDAELRSRHAISTAWLGDRRLGPGRHSAFDAAENAAGGHVLLDEHYRCHPDIAAVVNDLFYANRLVTLTDVRGRPAPGGRAVVWHDVPGPPQRGPGGTSWVNRAEIEQVLECVADLQRRAPDATIGIVAPYRAHADAIQRRLGNNEKVRVGTVHTFQGGECDAMVLSLVVGRGRAADWIDGQPELWNVAITRARGHLSVVGDARAWERRGGPGRALLDAAQQVRQAPGGAGDAATGLLHELVLSTRPDDIELGVLLHGHRADAVARYGGQQKAFLLDPGPAPGRDPSRHLRRTLQQLALLGPAAKRVPLWNLEQIFASSTASDAS